MDEKISKLFLPLLDKLYNTEPAGEPFRKPVDVVKYGCYDYYYYVKHPIDLSTIRKRLTDHEYKDAWRFIADIQLMFSNAYLFNKKGTPVYEFTNKLNKIWTSELTPIMQRLNYCCGTLHKFGPQLLFCHGTTPDRYCQIPIGAKYKCYEDQYSFCIPCFNKIESDYINIQGLSCETTRMKLPTQPVKKSDFIDVANDNWQYESFIQCTQCTRRVHQICDAYPADESELSNCIQHAVLEEEQKNLCQVPEEYLIDSGEETTFEELTTTISSDSQQLDSSKESNENEDQADSRNDEVYETSNDDDIQIIEEKLTNNTQMPQQVASLDQQNIVRVNNGREQEQMTPLAIESLSSHEGTTVSLDDELMQFARDVDDFTNSAPASPEPEESRSRLEKKQINCNESRDRSSSRAITYNLLGTNGSGNSCIVPLNAKNSVDSIAARLSINKLTAEAQAHEITKHVGASISNRDKFVCNHCYRKKKVGLNLRHRKYSARRLPHTRMSKYIETKVNEHIRENSPMAGEVTIRVLTAYRDTISVKPEMREYLGKCRQKAENPSQRHPNLQDYPDEFAYTNRAIFAWQEIDGVDVCVFGMHVQEYGEDCPEPNRQVVYLSYLDSVHFFRPKQVRTAVYHEILLSYFKYVKKLGFRRVFIWVCPSRKGDDYIFYRHPTEQKMPTLKRLSDWYINLLDKGIMAGIVERHQNIFQYAGAQNWTSILSIPYLSGDYWPGEFERLLKIMIESQKEYEVKLMQQDTRDTDSRLTDISALGECNSMNDNHFNHTMSDMPLEQSSLLAINGFYPKQPPNSMNGKIFNQKNSHVGTFGIKSAAAHSSFRVDGDLAGKANLNNESKLFGDITPDSLHSEEQPLDLSKSSSNASPETNYDDDTISEVSFRTTNSKKRRRKSNSTLGYIKKRGRASQSSSRANRPNQVATPSDFSPRFNSQPPKSIRQKSSTHSNKDPLGSDVLLNPEEELMKNLERSLKRQKEGFIVARLSECDCSPSFETQRRKEEATFTCDLMKGREPFLQLARLQNYEFSTLRRAKFSSLAMVKHLSEVFPLEPICNECFSFDSSKRHYSCLQCADYYLCTSCHENTQHEHPMSLLEESPTLDIDEFLPHCSIASVANSNMSSASSTISNKSSNEITLESSQSMSPTSNNRSVPSIISSAPLNRHLYNGPTMTAATTIATNMPLSCQRQKNRDFGFEFRTRAEDEENADIRSFGPSSKLPNQGSPPPSHSASNIRGPSNLQVELDEVLVDNFIRQAEVSYDVDFDQMKNESKKLLSHYWACPSKETCHKCKFVVLSCSFMSVIMRSSRMQMMMNCGPNELMAPTINNNNHLSGINLTTAHKFSYQPKD